MSEKNSVRIYTTTNCFYCQKAKQLLTRRKISFIETQLRWDDDEQWEALFRISGMKTMPQIFLGDQLIGGYTELAELDQKDALRSLGGS